ncbi:MAG TPA: hypothetical protein VFQ30_17845 [Ktedonobacteraceae bacterium]|nr:hypothetical protein [Ktedonobacteraceae bacterium]
MRLVWNLLKQGLGLLIVSGLLLLVSCSSSPGMDRAIRSTPASQSAPSLSTSWETIALSKLIGTDKAFLSYAVSPTDPETMYACTSDGSSLNQHPIRLWRTHDTGLHWSALSLPASFGTGCTISMARSQPQRIAVLMTNTYDNQRPCDQDMLYLSNDGGNSWKHIPYSSLAPQGARTVFCQVTVTAHSLYLCYSFISGGQNSPQVSLLERTDDDGASWLRIDSAFGSSALFSAPAVGADDTLAIAVTHVLPASKTQSVLWISHNAGNSWQQGGTLPVTGTYLLAPRQQNTPWPSSTAPFYVLANEQIPSDLYDLQAFQSGNGRQWTALPPLPAPGTSARQPGLLQALAVKDDGVSWPSASIRKLACPPTPLLDRQQHPPSGSGYGILIPHAGKFSRPR